MSAYLLLEREKAVMKAAQHHMRFHQYYEASYNFSALAELYVMENRLSEAKWYYLQSLLLSRRQGDQWHTFKNLSALGLIKADLGDIGQAQQDLSEARSIAVAMGRKTDVVDVDAKIYYVRTNKIWLPKSELRYADAAELPVKIK
ncbi:hypothetical protein [Mucilaginibacter pedocola]|uniref:MalT-like TPR region domain-containing protein n=1 Tax=Mucilaginibacter pedocola TaxID=1792845 RepID=A0A1S9PHS8_9SPHI|nr:hypothetical protein [Mucilaginibacter pedocola]OOQ60505.1 hypothetical protein BC343_24745 [Mucilaginibacter pedocola]